MKNSVDELKEKSRELEKRTDEVLLLTREKKTLEVQLKKGENYNPKAVIEIYSFRIFCNKS